MCFVSDNQNGEPYGWALPVNVYYQIEYIYGANGQPGCSSKSSLRGRCMNKQGGCWNREPLVWIWNEVKFDY